MWDRIWAIARIDLGLSQNEYEALDLREFTLLHDQVLRLRWQKEASLANIAAAVYRCSGMKKPPKATDFIFTKRPGGGLPVSRRQSREEVANFFRSLIGRHAR